MKVMTIVGTRPEIIRLSCVISAMDRYFEHLLVHTCQNWDYQLNGVFFEELGIREPDLYLEAVGEDLGSTIGNIIAKSYQVLNEHKPDALLVLGDTNSALSTIAAKRLKIPIFHMEAGNRCFDQNVPEEINRKLVDHISDINMPYTEHSRRYLIQEGISNEHIFVTGSPMAEVLKHYAERIHASKILDKLKLKNRKFILVSAHREENVDIAENFQSLIESLNEIAKRYQLPIVISIHPRTRKRIEESRIKLHPLIQSHKPFGFFDYNFLQKNAFCVLSDSGTLSEESAILGFPAVLIRTSTERPEAIEKGNVIVGGITTDEIVGAIDLICTSFQLNQVDVKPLDYHDTKVSEKVVRIIRSYTQIINQRVWGKKTLQF